MGISRYKFVIAPPDPSMALEQQKTNLTTPGKSKDYIIELNSVNLEPSSLSPRCVASPLNYACPKKHVCHSGIEENGVKGPQWASLCPLWPVLGWTSHGLTVLLHHG